MLRPNRPYNAAFNSCISSLSPLIFSSSAATSPSIFSTELDSSSCTSVTGNEKNESPILYLYQFSVSLRSFGFIHLSAYGTLSSSSASSSSVEISSRSSFCFCRAALANHSASLLRRKPTCLVLNSSSSTLYREWMRLKRLIFSWSSFLTSFSSPICSSSSRDSYLMSVSRSPKVNRERPTIRLENILPHCLRNV